MTKKTIISAFDEIVLKLKFLAKEKESDRKKLEVIAEEKEDVRKKLAIIAEEKEDVRKKLALTADELKNKASKLAIIAKEKEDVRKKLALTANKLASIAKEKEDIRRKLARVTKENKNTSIAARNVLEDLNTEKLKVEIARAKEQAILHSIGEGQVAIDEKGNVSIMNKVAEEMLGIKSEDVLGKSFTEIVIMEDEKGTPIMLNKRPLNMALTGTTTTTTTTDSNYYYVRKNKTKFPVAIVATPIMFNEKIIGAIEVFRNITKEKEVDRVKGEFVSLASHQLRTPLGIMKWYLEALENEDYFKKSPMVVRKYIDEVYKSNERVLSLVRDLLSVSRIDQGRVKNDPKLVNIISIIKEVIKQMKTITNSKKIILSLNIQDKKTPLVKIDMLRFHEVLENLISNAIEYTAPGGSVKVNVKQEGETLFIRIQDTGIGISLTDQKKLFTKFFRTEKAVKHNPEGSGLGLYLAKSYIEEWGGKISVESIESKGSTFTISLPI